MWNCRMINFMSDCKHGSSECGFHFNSCGILLHGNMLNVFWGAGPGERSLN